MLLTQGNALPSDVDRWLTDHAISTATILGGTAVISGQVESDLSASLTVNRIAGAARDATAVAILERLWSNAGPTMLVNGYEPDAWPYALMAAPLAARLGTPQLLTTREGVTQTTAAAIEGRSTLTIGPVRLAPATPNSER